MVGFGTRTLSRQQSKSDLGFRGAMGTENDHFSRDGAFLDILVCVVPERYRDSDQDLAGECRGAVGTVKKRLGQDCAFPEAGEALKYALPNGVRGIHTLSI